MIIVSNNAMVNEPAGHENSGSQYECSSAISSCKSNAILKSIGSSQNRRDNNKCSQNSTETCFGLPNSELFVVVEEIWFLFNLVSFAVSEVMLMGLLLVLLEMLLFRLILMLRNLLVKPQS